MWTGIKNNGAGKVEVFDNPVLGKCLKFTTTVLRHPGDPFRISPEKKIPHLDPSIKANWSLGSEIIFDVGFVPTGDASISIENVFSEIKELGIDYIPMASIDISSSSPSLKAKDPINIGCDWAKYRTTYELKVGIPYYFELKTMGPNIFLYINDELITSGPLHPNLVGVAPVMVKSGAYGYLIKPGKSMYEGNLSFQIFNYISTG
ncbi:MAG: hypothetical protein A2Z16_14635 [Chloroflexi bacterium RBG_16_54_18]|nr:MAG: hypothetical protein A2Z16_14635 [Chloroflexi bacterium RBG_16_54_18]